MLTMNVYSARCLNDECKHTHTALNFALDQSRSSDHTIYTIMIITLRHFLFNLIKDAQGRHNKIMFRVRCPKIVHNEFGLISDLSLLKSTKLIRFVGLRQYCLSRFCLSFPSLSLFLPLAFFFPDHSQIYFLKFLMTTTIVTHDCFVFCLSSSSADPAGCGSGCVLLLSGSRLHPLLSQEEECFIGGQGGSFLVSSSC